MGEPVTVLHPPGFAGTRRVYRDGRRLGVIQRGVAGGLVFRATQRGVFDAAELRAIVAVEDRLAEEASTS